PELFPGRQQGSAELLRGTARYTMQPPTELRKSMAPSLQWHRGDLFVDHRFRLHVDETTAVFIRPQKSRIVERTRRNVLLPDEELIPARTHVVNREFPVCIRRRRMIQLPVLATRHCRNENDVRTRQWFACAVQCRPCNSSGAGTQSDLKRDRLLGSDFNSSVKHTRATLANVCNV